MSWENAPALCPDGFSLHVLKTPVNVTLRRFAHGSDAASASWNLSLAGGQGGWQSDGCRILGHRDNFTTISCNSLGNYGLLMVGVATPCKCGPQAASHFLGFVVTCQHLSLRVRCRTSAAWSSSLRASEPSTR